MATTKNGKLKKLLKFCLKKKDTKEAEKPFAIRPHKEMHPVKDAAGNVIRTEREFELVDRSHGRNARRRKEIDRLQTALKRPDKKARMAGFAHKKDRAAARKAEKAAQKQGKGKKKKSED